MNSENQKALPLASGEENSQITRKVLTWLNSFPGLPVPLVDYEMLEDDKPGMAVTVPQGAAIRTKYVYGGHQAEFAFGLIYRTKTGGDVDKRLQAVELLDRLGDHAAASLPEIGEDARPLRVEVSARANLAARYENEDEDYQILLKLIYERNVI